MRRGLSLVCALALALSLTACIHREPQPTSTPTPEPTPTATATPTPTATPSAEPTPTPEPTPPVFDEDHELDRELPKLTSAGLELPIYGATGWAAVEIGLYEAVPTPTPTPTPPCMSARERRSPASPGRRCTRGRYTIPGSIRSSI